VTPLRLFDTRPCVLAQNLGGLRGLSTVSLPTVREFEPAFCAPSFDNVPQRSSPALTRIKCSGRSYYVALGLGARS
jgi:hypothetical protein